MEYEFEVQEPEDELEFVSTPQLLIVSTKNGHLKVIIYFMSNTALEINDGIAKSAMSKIKLQYTAVPSNDAYTASQILRKVVYTFTNPQGMASNFEFIGQKT